MPEISRFFGIVIAIYYKEPGLPHVHAKYAGQTGVFSIIDLKLIEGNLPKRVIALVLERFSFGFTYSVFKTAEIRAKTRCE
jgi:Domain of unknown function (DUF4160)